MYRAHRRFIGPYHCSDIPIKKLKHQLASSTPHPHGTCCSANNASNCCAFTSRLVRGGSAGNDSTRSKSSFAAIRLKRSKSQPRQRCTITYSSFGRWKRPVGSILQPQEHILSPGLLSST